MGCVAGANVVNSSLHRDEDIHPPLQFRTVFVGVNYLFPVFYYLPIYSSEIFITYATDKKAF